MGQVWLEGKRIARKSWVPLCFFLFLAMGIWISGLTLERSFRDAGCSLEQYLEAVESCRGMTLQEAAERLEEKSETGFRAMELFQNYKMGQTGYEEMAEGLAALGYAETSSEELNFSVFRAEQAKYRRVLEEVSLLLGYGDRMREIQQGGGGLSGISFFDEDQYVARTREKAKRDYAGLQVELDLWTPNVSAWAFLQDRAMDGLIVLFLTIVVLLLYVEEREKGYSALTGTARGGRQRFYAIKAWVLFGAAAVTVVVYEGGLLACDVWRLGGVVWDAPIQSIAAFQMCSHGLSVGAVIILKIVLKVLFMYILALALSALACLLRRAFPFFAVTAVIVLLCVVWEQTANVNDSLGWLSCFNPVRLTDTAGLLVRYRQFRLLDKPVSEGPLTGIFASVFAVVSLAAGFFFYARLEKGSGALPLWRRERIRRGKRPAGGFFLMELKKCMLSYRMILPILAVMLACGIYYYVSDDKAMSRQDRFYREYMLELNGPLTSEKEQFILKERERFRALEAFRNEVLAQEGDQSLLLRQIEDEMIKKSAFDLVEQQYARVLADGGVFLYETGFLYLMGLSENKSGRLCVFLGILVLTLFLPCFSWIELNGGADLVIRATRGGRGRVLLIQYGVCFLAAFLVFGSVCAGDAAKILGQFGSYGAGKAAGNISQLGGFMSDCSVGVYLGLVYGIRLLGVMLAVLLAQACVYCGRDYLSAVLACMVFLVIPHLLFINGFSFMRGYFMNAFLQGEELLTLFRQKEAGIVLWILLQTCVCGGVCLGILRREVKGK